jgi:hypothetical protein
MKDLRLTLLKQANQEETRQACLHYLGDKFQKYDEQLKLNSFWKTDIGKILSYGVHEHVHGASKIQLCCSLILKQIENKNLSEEDIVKYVNKIKEGAKTCSESIDYIYKQIKEL